jgi:pilus assembly protein CpaB
MNRNRLFIIALLAVAIAGVLTLATFRAMRRAAPAANSLMTAKIVVANGDLGLGARATERDLRVAEIAAQDVPAGAFTKPSEVVGRGIIVPIVKNEPVLSSKLAPEKAGAGLPSIIPPGMRAVSVRVNDVVSVAGFVVPGTRVDVLLTGNPGGRANPGDEVTATVLENVEVLAADQKLERQETGKPQPVAVITLLVSPEDAQKLTLAASGGHVQLVLRNPIDTDKQKPASVSQAALYHLPVATVAPVAPELHKVKRAGVPTVLPKIEASAVETIKGDKRDITRF